MGMPIIEAGTATRCEAIGDLVLSISMEETALSHILNAEGEKLQALIASAATAEDLLTVNKSVNNMVKAISTLEMVLAKKLGNFLQEQVG